jgi:hypothetical protein
VALEQGLRLKEFRALCNRALGRTYMLRTRGKEPPGSRDLGD